MSQAESLPVGSAPDAASSVGTESRESPRRRHVILAVGALAVVLALVGGTWWAARAVQSPAQREAAAAPPSPGVVTVAVTTGDLSDQITANGTVTAAESTKVALPVGSGAAVVTERLVQPGATLSAGQVLLRVNGRPLLVLPGAFPAYRDLTQGDQGDDVTQLQTALQHLGYGLRPDGDFGAATARALTRLYKDRGYQVPTTAAEEGAAGQTAADGTDASVNGGSGSGRETGGGDRSASSTGQEGNSAAGDGKAGQSSSVRRRTLVHLPAAEILYVPGLESAPVVSDLPDQGATLTQDNAVLTLEAGATHLSAEVPATTALSLATGARARAEVAGTPMDLTLATIAEKPTDTGAGGQEIQGGAGAGSSPVQAVTYTLTFTSAQALPAAATPGTPVLLTIERTPTVTGALIVPKRAVATAADGTHSVLRQRVDGGFETVPVEVAGCVAGQCALTGGTIQEGDELRVDGI